MKTSKKSFVSLLTFLAALILLIFMLPSCENADKDSASASEFFDAGFKEIVATALEKSPESLTDEDLSSVAGLDIYYYAERVSNSNEYVDKWSITVTKKGYHAAYEKYYSAEENERADLESPSNYTYNSSLDTFSGYQDISKFTALRDFSITSEYAIIKLNPLQYVNSKSLESLSVYNYVIPNLDSVSMYKNLDTLSIGINLRQLGDGETIEYISDLTPLKGLERLEELSLSGNSVSDLSPLASLKNLKSLSCTMSSLSDISSVSAIKSLESVNFYFNGISDVEPLTKLPNLKTIYLDYNYISDISPFAKLNKDVIEYVSLDMNSIEDLEPLKHLGKDKIYVGYDIYWDNE